MPVIPNNRPLMKLATQIPTFECYGDTVHDYGRRLPQGVQGLLCDSGQPAEALARAVQLRRNGAPFYVAIQIDHIQAAIARHIAFNLLYTFTTPSDRRQAFEGIYDQTLMINGSALGEHHWYPQPVLHTLREVARMADALLVRSHTERNYLESIFHFDRSYVNVAPLPDLDIPPNVGPSSGNRVVVWAPKADISALGMYLYAFWYLHQPALFVCNGTMPDSPYEFVPPSQGAQALSCAGIVVDTNLSDPGTSIALSQQGFSVVAAHTTGAHEWIQGLVTYDPLNAIQIGGATSRARGKPRIQVNLPVVNTASLRQTLQLAQPKIPPQTPLVSIVVPTYNRPTELRKSLDAFARQTYPNLEVLIVNDCGSSVEDIVREYPFARYLQTPVNSGPVKAVNIGLREARGEYLGLVADDDCDYPAHVTSLVDALLASGLQVGYSNIIIRLDTVQEDGQTATYGHLLTHDRDHDSVSAQWCGSCTHMQGYLAHREVFRSMNYLNEDLQCASDVDGVLAFSAHHDFVHVDRVTGEMAYRDDRSNMSSKAGQALVTEIAKVLDRHNPPDFPLIAERRITTLQQIGAAQNLPTFFYPNIRLTHNIPLP